MKAGDLVRFHERRCHKDFAGKIGLIVAVRPRHYGPDEEVWDVLVEGMLYEQIIPDLSILTSLVTNERSDLA